MPEQRDIIVILEDISDGIGDLTTLQGGGDTTALLTAIKNAVDGLEALIGTSNTALTSLQGYVDQLEGYVDSLEGNTDGLETLLGEVKTKLDTLHTDVDGLETLAGSTNTKLDTLHTDLAPLATATKQDTLATAVTATNTKLDTLHADVDGLETLLASQATSAKQDLLETAVKRLAPLGPGAGTATPSTSKIFNVSFTASAAQQVDIGGANYTGLKAAIDAGKLIMLKATASVWYHWGTAGVNVSTSAAAGNNPNLQAIPLFDGGESPERPPVGSTFLNLRGGSVDGFLCIYIAE
jgi:ABC-type transporter Mla subunit MlaD